VLQRKGGDREKGPAAIRRALVADIHEGWKVDARSVLLFDTLIH
jgi:hypothetical protein